MPRFALKIDYHGAPFCGWQRQPAQPTVQGVLEDALRKLQADAGPVYGAGRTDTGVHATGQVAHLDLERDWDPDRLCGALNYHVRPAPVAVIAAVRVDDAFHARFDAVERRYLYRMRVRRAPLTHEDKLVWRVGHALDVEAMQEGARALIGTHDFTTFRSSQCQAQSPVRTLDRVEVCREAGGGIRFDLVARSFLHNQVRSIVGSLERVGSGVWEPARIGAALAARDRTACGPMAPPDGLYLTGVSYESDPFGDRSGAAR